MFCLLLGRKSVRAYFGFLFFNIILIQTSYTKIFYRISTIFQRNIRTFCENIANRFLTFLRKCTNYENCENKFEHFVTKILPQEYKKSKKFVSRSGSQFQSDAGQNSKILDSFSHDHDHNIAHE